MKNLKKILVIILMMSMITIVSCKRKNPNTPQVDPYSGEFGKRIEVDLVNTNIINDNYRNYYEIFVRSFNDSNMDLVGDLNGVANKLDYIKDLGYNGIWLMPINPSNSYHKYDVNDYYSIDKQYGTIDDLKNLIAECHKRDIKLIIDLVLNHSGKANPYFTKACKAYDKYLKGETLTEEEKKFKDFYVFYPNKNMIPSGITAYKAGSEYSFYYEANFSDTMPEFNIDSQAVRDEFKKIAKFYIDMGIDGFRLDAVKYFYYGDTNKNISFLAWFNQTVKAMNPNAYIVGECFDGYDLVKKYYESGVDSFFNFSQSVAYSSVSGPLNGTNPEGRGINKYYDSLLSNIKIANGKGIPAPFLDNHDMPRYTYVSSTEKNKFTFGLLAMMNGTLFSYYGDEVGLFGTNKGANNVDQNVRIPIKWGDFTNLDCSMISGVTNSVYPYPTVQEQIEDSNSILNYYKQILLLRNQNPEIARGEIELIEKVNDTNKYLLISKTYNGSKIGILINFSSNTNLNIDYRTYGFSKVVGFSVINSSQYVGEQRDGSILLPPYSIVILK